MSTRLQELKRRMYADPKLCKENWEKVVRYIVIDSGDWVVNGPDAEPHHWVMPDPCWIWRGGFFTKGHSGRHPVGTFQVPRVKVRLPDGKLYDEYANRVIWQLHNDVLTTNQQIERAYERCTNELCTSHFHYQIRTEGRGYKRV